MGKGAISGTDILVVSGSEPGTPNLPSLRLQLQNNVTDNGYFLANGLTATATAALLPPVPLSVSGTFEQTFGNSADRLVGSGSLNLPPVGLVRVNSADSTTDTCSRP